MSDIILIPPGESASLSPASSAFAHGFGLFETMRYADGQLYFWQDHWARLAKSARYFALALPAEDAVLSAIRELASAFSLGEATLKLSLVKSSEGSCLYVYSRPPIPAPGNRRLRLDANCPLCPRSLLSGHKTHNYMEAMHLLGLARALGYYDILRVDTAGHLAETTTANLFFCKDGRLHTPSLEAGILPGVIRGTLLSAPELAVREGLYEPEELLGADAAFVTNATFGLQPIERIEGFAGGELVEFHDQCPVLREAQAVFAQRQAESALKL